jgi:Uma2 family endonuclease
MFSFRSKRVGSYQVGDAEEPMDLTEMMEEKILTRWIAEYPDFPIVLRPMTEEEFVAWCDEDTRAEFKDGEVIVFSPSSWRHSQIVRFLVSLLTLYVEKHGLGMVAGQAFQVRLRPGLRREPDVLFISKEQTESIRETWVEGAPSLVVEVVSPDSLERDWREKYYEYRDAGVKEYWVIDPYAKAMAVYQLEGGQYKRIKPEKGIYRSKAVPGFWLKPEWLWKEPLPKVLDTAKEMEIV